MLGTPSAAAPAGPAAPDGSVSVGAGELLAALRVLGYDASELQQQDPAEWGPRLGELVWGRYTPPSAATPWGQLPQEQREAWQLLGCDPGGLKHTERRCNAVLADTDDKEWAQLSEAQRAAAVELGCDPQGLRHNWGVRLTRAQRLLGEDPLVKTKLWDQLTPQQREWAAELGHEVPRQWDTRVRHEWCAGGLSPGSSLQNPIALVAGPPELRGPRRPRRPTRGSVRREHLPDGSVRVAAVEGVDGGPPPAAPEDCDRLVAVFHREGTIGMAWGPQEPHDGRVTGLSPGLPAMLVGVRPGACLVEVQGQDVAPVDAMDVLMDHVEERPLCLVFWQTELMGEEEMRRAAEEHIARGEICLPDEELAAAAPAAAALQASDAAPAAAQGSDAAGGAAPCSAEERQLLLRAGLFPDDIDDALAEHPEILAEHRRREREGVGTPQQRLQQLKQSIFASCYEECGQRPAADAP